MEVNLTGLSEAKEQSLKIWPTPARNLLNIEVPESGQLQLFDLRGTLLLTKNLAKGTHQISLVHQPSGVYILRLTGQGASYHQRIIQP
jgi:hypothetical protein